MTAVTTRATSRVHVSTSEHAGCVSVVLARPDKGNAIDTDFAVAFRDAARDVRAAVDDHRADCVVIRAEGRHFCVGGDLADFPADEEQAVAHFQTMATTIHEGLSTLLGLEVPIVARVQGVAAGAGIGLAAFADVVVASTAAAFIPAYSTVGLSPDCGVSWLLPRLVGERRAADLLLTNRRIDAATAERWGLVSRVVAPEDLDGEVDSAVAAIVAGGRTATVETKRLLRSAATNHLRAHLADEAQTVAALGGSPHALAARAAFGAGTRDAGRAPVRTGSEIS